MSSHPQYQSFSDARGNSDSAAKLARIGLPRRLEGLSVLDVGCNEGFFCQEAWRRGAARVVGIDSQEPFLERARTRDSRTEFRHLDWDDLSDLDEVFDVVLFLSALHYAKDPEALLRDLFARLSPDGTLILECGVAPGREASWQTVSRPAGDVVKHPTRSMVMRSFPDGVVRYQGMSVSQTGDPLPRAVFKVTRRRPTLLLVQGDSGTGKTTLAATLGARGWRNVNLDHLLFTLSDWATDRRLLELRASREFTETRLHLLGEMIAEHECEERFVNEVIKYHPLWDDPGACVVIEGHVLGCGRVATLFANRFRARGVFVWDVRPAGADVHGDTSGTSGAREASAHD